MSTPFVSMRYPTTSKEQCRSLWKLFCRAYDTSYEDRKTLLRRYRAFRRTAFLAFSGQCLMVRWAGMLIGIERDGHTHS